MRRFFCRALLGICVVALSGCNTQHRVLDVAPQPRVAGVWGTRGAQDGEFTEPRALTTSRDAMGARGFVYATDLTGRILKWTTTGQFVTSWKTPKLPYNQPEGPEGICVLPNGNIAFTNTHASNVVIFSPTGKIVRKFGTYGTGRGQFLLVTGIAADRDGFIYCADYGGEFDRISKWTSDGKIVAQWIGHGEKPRQFRRPCGLAIARKPDGSDGDLLVADIGNHRIQRLDRKTGAFRGEFGVEGRAPGRFNYPYGVAVDPKGQIFTVEYGTHRVQKWSRDGKYIATWGKPGHGKNQLANPRGIAVDNDSVVYVADTKNNRIQKVVFPK